MIGEGGCGQAQPIDPMLIEAVAGRLDDQILDAGARQLGRQPVKRDRVRRGQAALARCIRGLQAQRAQARRRVPEAGPQLPGERRDRGLAAGAGDRRHDARLPCEKTRRDPRQRRPRLRGDQGRHRDCRGDAGVAQHGHRPGRQCIGEIAAAVGPRPWNGSEQVARTHGARVRGQAADIRVACTLQTKSLIGERCQAQS